MEFLASNTKSIFGTLSAISKMERQEEEEEDKDEDDTHIVFVTVKLGSLVLTVGDVLNILEEHLFKMELGCGGIKLILPKG